MGPTSFTSEYDRRAVVRPRRAPGNEGEDVENGQRFTAVLGEPEEMRFAAWDGVADQTAHDATDLVRRQGAYNPPGTHQKKSPISMSTSNFLIHTDQDSTEAPDLPPELGIEN